MDFPSALNSNISCQQLNKCLYNFIFLIQNKVTVFIYKCFQHLIKVSGWWILQENTFLVKNEELKCW